MLASVALVGALGTTLTLLDLEGPTAVRATPLATPSTTPAPAPAGSLPSVAHGDAAYWRFADRMAVQLDADWDARAGYYRSGRTEPQFNANLLLVHSVAAQSGHRGPARDDSRARRLAARLVASPPFVERGARRGGTTQTHMPGWTTAMEGQGVQHLVFDADLVDGLVAAYRARRALRLPPATVRGIADRIHRTVSGPFWRWPAIRLNQINWYALMYAADATVTGNPLRLRRDLRRQIVRFARQAQHNFGPGLGFHYLPHRPPATTRSNLDSAEYANIVLSFSRFLAQARAAGMKPLPRRATALLRGWARRAVAGYWTHGGYLNWDTGLGFNRWHQTKKLALSQQGLIGVAQSPTIAGRRWREWAKWMLDRGFVLFDDWSRRAGGIAPGLAFGVNVRPQSGGDARLAAARMASNAARAVAAGLGSLEARRPPALYAYDPATGRLAVTTPSYNTAVVPVSQGAFPYGGIDLARLYDGSQRVAAGIGGRPPASFGVVVRDVTGRALLATQRPQSALGDGPPVRLTRAPAGVDVAAATAERRAYAGPFRDLRLRGAVTAYGLRADSRYRFTPGFVDARWRVASTTAAPLSTDVLFPSWGAGARVTMVERDGRAIAVGRAPVPLSGAAYLHVQSADSGYVVVVRRVPAGATARLLAPRRQSSAPHPGPTLALQLTRGVRFRRTGLSVRIATAPTPEAAAQAVSRGG